MFKYLSVIPLFLYSVAFATERLDDFAYQAEITVVDAELQRLQIPMEVLLNVTRGDLADIAVFDQQGNLLPHTVMKTLPTLTDERVELNIHTFDVFYSDHAKVVTTRQQRRQADQLSELQTTETIETRLRRTDYLLELPEDRALGEIELEWSQQPENQLLKVRLEVGTELDRLRLLDASKTLSNSNPDEPAWRRIDKLPNGQKYLRITPAEPIDRFELLRAVGHYQTSHPPARLEHRVNFTEVTIKDRPYLYFETPTAVAPEALSIIPGQAHSMISATVFAGSSDFEKNRQIRNV